MTNDFVYCSKADACYNMNKPEFILAINERLRSDNKKMESIKNVIKMHTNKLDTMKFNRSRSDEEKWSDADISECDKMISTLASILSDLNKIV